MTTTISERPAARDRVIVLKSAEETAGEFFRCEYIAREVSAAPRDHIHTHQEERLEVVEGTVRCRVAGREHVLERGTVMVIPAGRQSHMPSGTRTRVALARFSEYRPAMNAQAMFRGYIVSEYRNTNPSITAAPERIVRR